MNAQIMTKGILKHRFYRCVAEHGESSSEGQVLSTRSVPYCRIQSVIQSFLAHSAVHCAS
jgi:hypothetical protein